MPPHLGARSGVHVADCLQHLRPEVGFGQLLSLATHAGLERLPPQGVVHGDAVAQQAGQLLFALLLAGQGEGGGGVVKLEVLKDVGGQYRMQANAVAQQAGQIRFGAAVQQAPGHACLQHPVLLRNAPPTFCAAISLACTSARSPAPPSAARVATAASCSSPAGREGRRWSGGGSRGSARRAVRQQSMRSAAATRPDARLTVLLSLPSLPSPKPSLWHLSMAALRNQKRRAANPPTPHALTDVVLEDVAAEHGAEEHSGVHQWGAGHARRPQPVIRRPLVRARQHLVGRSQLLCAQDGK